MGEKDITEKILEAYNDVFADIVNVLIFNGNEVVKENELEEQAPKTAYKVDNKIREIERDVAKRWKNRNIRIACVGLENQTIPDKDMPFRVIAYDGAEYRAQLNGKARYPVITLVLYFGHERHWNKPLNLKGCMNVPEVMDDFVNDYRINLFEIAYLPDETIKKFKSDFGIVADYFSQLRKYGEYKGNPQNVKHVQEVIQMMRALTGNKNFEELYEKIQAKESGVNTMKDWFDRALEKREKEAKTDVAEKLLKENVEYDLIARCTGLSIRKIKQLKSSMLTAV